MAITTRFDDALTHALELHRNQLRKGTDIPYYSHLMAVAGMVWEHGGDEEQVIAALLHDAVEDAGGASPESQNELLDSIRQRHGVRVARIVEGCSDSLVLGKHGSWHDRKRDYIRHVESAEHEMLIVTLADKMHNATTILHDLKATALAGNVPAVFWQRFSKQPVTPEWIAETVGYYAALSGVFVSRGPIGKFGVLEHENAIVVDQIAHLSSVQPDLSWVNTV